MLIKIRPCLASTLGLLVATVATVQVTATDLSDTSSVYALRYEPLLKSVPALELPAKSASLVTAAKPAQKEPVALAVVAIVSKINPSSVPPVVGAISRAEPSVSAKVIAEAARLQPTLVNSIKIAGTGTVTPKEVPSLPPPLPTDSNGKKKGHYKNGQLGWYP